MWVIKAFQGHWHPGACFGPGHANTEGTTPTPANRPMWRPGGLFDDVRRLHSQYCLRPPHRCCHRPRHRLEPVRGRLPPLHADLARELDTLLTIHTLETREGQRLLSGAPRGIHPLNFTKRPAVLDTSSLAVHCALIQPHEVETWLATGWRRLYNAISNMLVGYQTLPVCQLLEHGIPVGPGYGRERPPNDSQ